MWLLAYNRKLAWVVVPAAVWAVLGLSLALGVPGPGGGPGGMHLGAPDGGIWLHGHLISLAEQDDGLHVVLAAPPGEPFVPPLPDRLFVEIVEAGPDTLNQTPEIDLPEANQIMRLRGNRAIVLTQDFIVRFGRGDLRIAPRPRELRGELVRRWFEQQRQRDERPGRMEPPPGRGPRGNGPPGEGPPGWSEGEPPLPPDEGFPWPPGEEPPGAGPPPSEDQPPPDGDPPPPDGN
ncbi:hypothetical protein JW859_07540 [bacterium]|nr:hypothetical protein [bacterium]